MLIAETIDRWSRLGLDPTVHNKDVVRRTRLLVVATIVTIGLGLSVFGSAVALGHEIVAGAVLAAIATAVLNLLIHRRSRRSNVAGVTLVVIVYATALLGTVGGGALWRGRVAWYALLPMLGFLVLDTRTGRRVTWIVAVTAVLLWTTEVTGGVGGTAVWVLADRLAAIVAAGVVGGTLAQAFEQATGEAEEGRRSLMEEIEVRRRAEETALAAGHAKTRFLGNMSHEIRTPMVGIMGMTDLILGTELTPVQRNYALTLRQSGQNLLAIINDILDFVKIDERKLEFERVPVRLRSVVEDALELLDPLAEQRGIDLVTRFSPDTAEPILGDPVRIRQILLNLIGNAIKFTAQGHILVKVEIVVRSAPRRGVKFTIQDTGVGISPSKIGRLFEPFTQADISTSRAYGGTGLGLAICKQLTDLMHGEIGVESVPGKGSTFWFTLPGELAPPVHDSDRASPALQDKVVLVASEHAFTRETARDLARYLGARRVDSVWSASEIAGALRNELGVAPDLVLVDSRMSKLSVQAWANARDAEIVLLVPSGGPIPRGLMAGTDVRIAPIPVREKTFLMAVGDDNSPAAPPVPRQTNAAVLVAEDVEVNRTVIRALAERLGCRVDLAANGLEAVELVTENDYDLVLMDCNMPVMDGYAATRKIRQLGYDEKRLPIVALTANIMPGERERCEGAGMSDYLPKPLGQDELERCFQRWIGRERHPRSADDAGPSVDRNASDTPPSPLLDDSPEDAPIFDHAATLKRLGGNEQLLLDIVRSFQGESREILEEIREMLARRDPERLRSGAHKLKGALASIGGEAARGLAARLEATAKAGDLEPASTVVARLMAEMKRLEDEIDAYVAARPD